MKFNLFSINLTLLIPQILAMPNDATTEFEEEDYIPSVTNIPATTTSSVSATIAIYKRKDSTTNRDTYICTNYDLRKFSSACNERTGTVSYTTRNNCRESIRCIYDNTTVSFNNDKYTFPPNTTTITTTTTITYRDFRDYVTCTNLDLSKFASACHEREGSVTYSTFGFNCRENIRCIYDSTVVPFNFDNYTFPDTITKTTITTTTTTTTTDFHDIMTCSNYDLSRFSSTCKQRTGTVTYSTYGFNCRESVRCIYDGTTVSLFDAFPPTITSQTSTPTNDIKISTNDKCSKNDGKCPTGNCCSKYGWCGKSETHCSVEKGCNSEFGDCRCGEGFGNCPSGQCCSKYGWCGKSEKHCSIEKGCNSEFGDCRCGEGFGNCPSGLCCSKKGYCGTTSAYCLSSKGCQSEFGKCKCGENAGKCSSSRCCSQKGYCGTTSAYCSSSKGCQSKYGLCR